MKLLVTGGAGFIGSAVVRHVIAHTTDSIVNLDKLTYAATLDSVADVADSGRYAFEQVDVCDAAAVARVLAQHEPDAIVHLAAETHVDRSIDAPAEFVRTNVVGTCTLLAAAEAYWRSLPRPGRDDFRFHHVSTDEVFGDLAGDAPPAGEESAYRPSSPYAASKAGADHLARAWHRTYGLPVVLSNSSNNYGPFQFPEKLIPLMVLAAIDGRPLPVYGDGTQVRDWLHVEDHARALHLILTRGVPGESYNVGGGNQLRNIDTVLAICDLLDELVPARPAGVRSYRDLVTRVTDRPGHDRRYALDSSKVRRELGWEPRESFESGLRSTVRWYIDNAPWCRRVQGRLRAGERPGLPRTEVASP